MSEPTQPTIEQLTAELEILRRTNAELIAKNTTRKAKIAELEAANADFQTKLTAASDTIHQVTIEGPLKQMAESISNCPDLWLEQFSKSYRVEMVGGKLSLLSASDGKPVQKDGKVIPFERQALAQHLTSGDGATAKAFKAITAVSRASGAQGTFRSPTSAPKASSFQFGLGK